MYIRKSYFRSRKWHCKCKMTRQKNYAKMSRKSDEKKSHSQIELNQQPSPQSNIRERKLQALKQIFYILLLSMKINHLRICYGWKIRNLLNCMQMMQYCMTHGIDVPSHSGCLISSIFHPGSVYSCLKKNWIGKLVSSIQWCWIGLSCMLHVKLIEM